MPRITAIIHTSDSASSIERALDSLRVCDDIFVVDECSTDDTEKLARSKGASVKKSIAGVTLGAYAMESKNDWVLVICPNEELDPVLIQSLEDWKQSDHDESGFAFSVREERNGQWSNHLAEMRLVNRRKINWVGELPPNNTMAPKLPGDILRYLQ